MIPPLAIAITVGALVGAGAAVAAALTGTFRWPRFVPTLVIVEAALVVQAVADGIGLARGHRPGEQGPHLAYLATSLLVVPAAATQARAEDGRWAGLLVAAGLLVVAVVVVRLATTWRSG